MGIHTVTSTSALQHPCYPYVFSAPPPPSHTAKGASATTLFRGTLAVLPPGHDIYDMLDKYFMDMAYELPLGAPLDGSGLVHYLGVLHSPLHGRAIYQPSAEQHGPPVRQARCAPSTRITAGCVLATSCPPSGRESQG